MFSDESDSTCEDKVAWNDDLGGTVCFFLVVLFVAPRSYETSFRSTVLTTRRQTFLMRDIFGWFALAFNNALLQNTMMWTWTSIQCCPIRYRFILSTTTDTKLCFLPINNAKNHFFPWIENSNERNCFFLDGSSQQDLPQAFDGRVQQ
jgi:hypothetical protein